MVRLKKAVPPRETGITRRAVADLQAQIESLTAAVAALSTQHATPVFRQERNNQTAIDDEFEEDKNPLSRLRCQPLIRNNNNNDSYFDNKYEDLDIKVYDTRDNDNSYVVQLGDDTEKNSTHDVANEDVTEIAPIYDMFEEDEMNQVIVGKVEDESIKFNESVYAEEIPTFSTEAFVKIMAANIFLNSSSVAVLAGALAAERSTAGVWRLVSLPPLRGVCMFSASSVDMSGAKVLEHLEFWVSVHDLHSTRRTRFLHSTSYVIWLEQDECTCDQAPVTLSWKIKRTYEVVGGSEERDKNVSQMVLFNVWERRFPFRFEVESFKPGGT
uniref:Uncharacterized protein n=1 Tax=Brassica campestris TaxID=3711 RepID=M4E6R3_BRACM